jgi:hypothetical protein
MRLSLIPHACDQSKFIATDIKNDIFSDKISGSEVCLDLGKILPFHPLGLSIPFVQTCERVWMSIDKLIEPLSGNDMHS